MSSKIKIGLLFGGRSAEHEISLTSAAAIYSHLDPQRFQVRCLYINRQGDWKPVDSPPLSPTEQSEGPFLSFLPWMVSGQKDVLDVDVYFPVLHGPFGEDGTIQGLFELADVAYIGATVLASAAAMDKAAAKSLFRDRGLPVTRSSVFLELDWRQDGEHILDLIEAEFPTPFFVKPANLGSSVGITKVKDPTQTAGAMEKAFRYDRKILVEESISGREFECSVLGNDRPRASLPGEIIPHREFYDYRDKYIEGRTGFAIPAKLPEKAIKEIQNLSVEAFRAIDACGMARVDFFLQDNDDKLLLNEINTIPGFTEISMYPKLWEVSGLPFPALLDELIDLALEKHKTRKRDVRFE